MINTLWSGLFIADALAEEEGVTASNSDVVEEEEAAASDSDVAEEEGAIVSDSDASIEALEARLLGEIEEVPTDGIDIQSLPEDGFPLWVYPLGMLAIVVLLLSRWKRSAPVNPGEIRIVSKTSLGREGSLVIVEVGSDDGVSKKLLLGLHGNSTPRLIDYLSSEEVISMVSEDTDPRRSSQRTRVAIGEGFEALLQQQEEKDVALEDRNDLVDEVLKARGLSATRGVERYQQVANEPHNPLDFSDDDDDPWEAGFRNIYNQKSK